MDALPDALPDAFLKSDVDLLPLQVPPRLYGVSLPTEQLNELRVIWFVLAMGCRRKRAPPEASYSGEIACTRLQRWREAESGSGVITTPNICRPVASSSVPLHQASRQVGASLTTENRPDFPVFPDL